MKTKHTPGPWFADFHATYGFPAKLTPNIAIRPIVLSRVAPFSVAKVERLGSESEANARLIAAAPDLLEALLAFPGFTDDATAGDAWIEMMRAAIAEATEEI